LSIIGHAIEILKVLFKAILLDSNFLFPRTHGQNTAKIRRGCFKATEKDKIKDFKFHDLRHSTAIYLYINPTILAEIAKVLVHKMLAMVKYYPYI
jgi:integrase